MQRRPLYLDYTAGEVKELADDDTLENSFIGLFPVNSVVSNTSNADPTDTLGYGAWIDLGSVVIGATTVYYFKRVE